MFHRRTAHVRVSPDTNYQLWRAHPRRDCVSRRSWHSFPRNNYRDRCRRILQAGISVLLTRFLITGMAVPVNLIAGTGGFPFRRFLFYDLSGEAIWIFGYGGLGYLFGTQWEAVSAFLSNMSGLLLGLLILGVGIWLGLRRLRTSTAIKESG